MNYRNPTALEREFLRLVSKGHPPIEEQVEHCSIADYDPAGWCDVLALSGTPWTDGYRLDGPSLRQGKPDSPTFYVETRLSMNAAGMLQSVEIIAYVPIVQAPYQQFVEAEKRGELRYPT